jgi:hypothetical protein
MKLVTYYNEIINNMPAFFDLEKGTIYNLNVSEIDCEDESPMSFIRFRKSEVQIYRDRCAVWFQRTCRLLSDNPNGE